ncbi:DUF429 domain-containing protein [Pseudogracilibacillus sp. SE30717A]|uniref:DUF429 domain-containing protein n=1 Tax=Pseudogracilibacillus sp. SE30717A TaxID=3098293 RepID=UPI00300E55DD
MKYKYCSIGIDGCRDGWVLVALTEHKFEIRVLSKIHDAKTILENSKTTLIDIPIGLPETSSENSRRPEATGRKILGKRASCIFNTPCRQAVYANNYTEANKLNKGILQKGLSKQSYYLTNKIKEVDNFLASDPSFKNKLIESHPEICFTMLNKEKKPIIENKNTDIGMKKRVDILIDHYPKTVKLTHYINDHPELRQTKVDIIDAFVLAVTGCLGNSRGLSSIPASPIKDSRGLFMQMVYCDYTK